MFKKKLLLAALFAAAAQTGFAADQSSGMYVLGSIGQSKISIDKASFDSGLTSAGATGLSSTTDEKDTGYKLQLGYQYNQNFAIEGGYINLGKFKYNATYTGGAASAEVKAKGWNIDAVGIAPLNDAFSLLGKIGLIRGKVDATVSATGPGGAASESVSASKWKTTVGFGVSYNVSKTIAVRGEFERFLKLGDANTTGEGDVSLFSVGVVAKF